MSDEKLSEQLRTMFHEVSSRLSVLNDENSRLRERAETAEKGLLKIHERLNVWGEESFVSDLESILSRIDFLFEAYNSQDRLINEQLNRIQALESKIAERKGPVGDRSTFSDHT
jgi:chromosome segregation ATPase